MPKPIYLLTRTIIKFTISKQDLQVVQILFIEKIKEIRIIKLFKVPLGGFWGP
jgi:hypothetical protein